MKIIGLTGGIASGKNLISDIFKEKGAMVFDADQEVHDILKLDKTAILEVGNSFPQALVNGEVDRKILGKAVFSDAKKIQILEGIIHPKVRERYEKFLKLAKEKDVKIVVLNIPLLLEKKGYECDIIIAIVTFKFLQKYRFLQRYKQSHPQASLMQIHESKERFLNIRSIQMSNFQRIKQSDFVIFNGLFRACVIRHAGKIISRISE